MIHISKITRLLFNQRDESIGNDPMSDEIFNISQLAEHAKLLALAQRFVSSGCDNYLLERLNSNDDVLRKFNQAILIAKSPRHITPAMEWLVDNFYLIEEHIQLSRRHFPKDYCQELPCLTVGKYRGLPRVYEIVLEYLLHVDAQIDEEALQEFVRAYQSISPLTLGELWAIPIMLRLALIENLQRLTVSVQLHQRHRDLADAWVARLQMIVTKSASGLVEGVAEMAKSNIPLSSAFVAEFCQRLSSQSSPLHIARTWLEQRLIEEGLAMEELIHMDGQNQASGQVSVSHGINSLRFLGLYDWKEFVEDQSVVDIILRKDPAGVYEHMDFATRDRYRHRVEELAKYSTWTEVDVAKEVVLLAEDAREQDSDKVHTHVGYYLIGAGQPILGRTVEVKLPFKNALEHTILARPLLFYLGGITLLTGFALWGFVEILEGLDLWQLDWKCILTSLLFSVCVSQLSVSLMNWLSIRLVKPKMLPHLDFSEGIPMDCRTVVAVPTMLSSVRSIDKLIENMELHYLSNRDEELFFALLTDYGDAPKAEMPADAMLLEYAHVAVERLNNRYAPNENNRFFLFHRPRVWNPGEGVWMGHERKRGKLMDFNTLLRNSEEGRKSFSLIVGNLASLAHVKYVISLDTDTQLPRDMARKLVGTMAHPLNQPVYDSVRNIITSGYGVLQPRVSVSLPSSRTSVFASLFSGDAGIDPYTRAVSDVYQDVFGEGSYVGKGIYDVDMFERILKDRFPENKILSHDLLESTFVRSGLVSDVELYEPFPVGYHMDAARRFRWIRGDWQVIQWLFPRVPNAEKRWVRNPLSGVSKWKLFDNLRRSLMNPTQILFLIFSCLFFTHSQWIFPVLLVALLALPVFIESATAAFRKSRELPWRLHLYEVMLNGRLQVGQLLLFIVLLPYEAYLATHAILRSAYRLVISHKHLLEWQTSAEAERTASNTVRGFYNRMWFSPFLALSGMIMVQFIPTLEWLSCLPLLMVWLVAPWISWRISCPIHTRAVHFTVEQTLLMHRIARKTWFFFETFVTEQENGLPPDNFQEIPQPSIASRTSPTNIGLSLLANLAANDFGYLSMGGVIERTQKTFASLSKMETFRGHFFNWYDTRTLQPLAPLYISSVDSGNLAGHLLTLGQGLRELSESNIYSPKLFEGLSDTVRVLKQVAGKNPALTKLEAELSQSPPLTLSAAYTKLKKIGVQIEAVMLALPQENEQARAWAVALRQNCSDHLKDILTLAPWLELTLLPETEWGGHLGELRLQWIKLNENPALRELVQLDQTLCVELASGIKSLEDGEGSILVNSMTQWLNCLHQANTTANQRIGMLRSLAKQSTKFASMDFMFLYDNSKKLFTIGYNVTEQRADAGCYDLLASEARLCSYVAIALGQVNQEHWFSLSRLLVATHSKPILLSWSGSMFEYLMPLLVMPNFENTLLDQTCKAAVQEQIEYGKTMGVPWGISESGYNRTDAQLNYQYRAFGIPSLGLKRGLSEELVIAPYASVMALMVSPQQACANMQRLTSEGNEGDYGYYEAMDYTAIRMPPDSSHESIRSFMSHHQGMSFLSLNNVMHNNAMQRRFIACPMLKAAELLLQERIPVSIMANVIADDSQFELEGVHPLVIDSSQVMRVFKDMSIDPEVHLLSNGNYHVMVSNSGGGYSRWRNLSVTRWREDATRDCWGLFAYICDTETGQFWSTAYQPTCKEGKGFEAIFTQAYAEFSQRIAGLNIHTTICVSPEDDIELRNIRIVNRSHVARAIELTSYSEVVIAPQDADEAHPAFSNLFVQTEFDPQSSAIYATRRARSQEEMPPHLLHMMLVQSATQDVLSTDVSCETDRSRFVGRGQSMANPQAMQKTGPLSNTTGPVLDPIISLRREVVIQPGETIYICMALGMSESKAGVLEMARKYQNNRMIDRAFKLAWTHSQIVLHQLNVSESDAQLFGRLAGSLVYCNASRRSDSSILKSNRQGQSGLWRYSISGDVPFIVVTIHDSLGMTLVRQIVMAHSFLRMKGLTIELMILNEDTSGYRQVVHEEIVNLISSGIQAQVLNRPGGIFVRPIDQVQREDILLLLSAARVVLSDQRGTLVAQLTQQGIPEFIPPAFKASRSIYHEPQDPLPQRESILNNGLGGFTPDGHEYVIVLQPGQHTPAPWCNVLANEQFGSVISESGGSYTWAQNAHEFRLTPWHNDPVLDTSGEAFYIRDEQTGEFWSPSPHPAKGTTPYVIRHGFGYTVFEHSENGIESELWVYVSIDAPVKFSVLKLRNKSKHDRRISVTGYCEWVLADQRTKSLQHVQTEIDLKTGALSAQNTYNHAFAGQMAFMDVGESRTVTGDRKGFLGQNGNLSRPIAMQQTRLSGKVGAGLDPCGAMQVVFDLAEGQERETCFRLGFAQNKEEMRLLVKRFQRKASVREALESVWNYWNRTLGAVNVDTPDPAVNVMTNGWLLYQTLSCRLWARSGFYQSGGAYGFRDQLQDVMALVHAEPAIVRKHILRAAGHQFKEGDVQHWWHPPVGIGVRTHFSDDYLWLPYVTCCYVNAVADTGILDETVSFLEGYVLRPDEESRYDLPRRSEESGTLYEHCVRSIEYGLKFGKHGLPLMGGGDWNDGMNLVGKEGKGESVWLAFFLYDVLMQFSKLAKQRHDTPFANRCIGQATLLQTHIEQSGWDNEWYRRAYFDDGEPLGSSINEECKIDSLPQSWSVISGAGNPDRSMQAMEQVNLQLVDRSNQLVKLFSPPFDQSSLNPGYIKGYIPGVRENGGQYTHAAIWAAMAYAKMGQPDRAWELCNMLNPVQHTSTAAQVGVYQLEPYVMAADVYAFAPHAGRGGWSWYTGSSAWMYRLLLETLLGIRKVGNELHLAPCFPKEWNSYKVHYRYGESLYHITFLRLTDSVQPRLTLDGTDLKAQTVLLLKDDRREHFVDMWLRPVDDSLPA